MERDDVEYIKRDESDDEFDEVCTLLQTCLDFWAP